MVVGDRVCHFRTFLSAMIGVCVVFADESHRHASDEHWSSPSPFPAARHFKKASFFAAVKEMFDRACRVFSTS